MDKQRFLGLLLNPAVTSETDTDLLAVMVREYPYFHLAHLLLLYNYKVTDNKSFNTALQDYALRINDRKVLFNLVNNISPVLKQPISSSQLDVKPQIDTTSEEFVLEDSIPIVTANATEIASEPEVTASDIEIGETLQIVDDTEENARVIEFDLSEPDGDEPNKSRNIIDNFLSSIESPPSEKVNVSDNDPSLLIDRFISENPAFTVNKLNLSEEHPDISTDSVVEDEELVSEALARVYQSQKLYDKAIAVYEKLILKFPEKSTYFASQIEELRIKFK